MIGANIANERKARGFRQDVLAERLKMTQATVSRWESGEREIRISDLLAVADVLGCPLLALVKGADAESDAYRKGYEDGWRDCADDVARHLTWKPGGLR
jgi:transcriptional regulator with XRE-family HTH domain